MACIYGPFDCDICPKDEPAAAHEPPAADCDAIVADICKRFSKSLDYLARQEAIPDTARRILDMGRTQQAVATQPADPRAEGIARAAANLNRHEKRLGASRFQP
jgi:hypothetical protein